MHVFPVKIYRDYENREISSKGFSIITNRTNIITFKCAHIYCKKLKPHPIGLRVPLVNLNGQFFQMKYGLPVGLRILSDHDLMFSVPKLYSGSLGDTSTFVDCSFG